MKRIITGLFLSVLIAASSFGQTVITDSGKDVVIQSGSGGSLTKKSYPKSQIGTELKTGVQLNILLGRMVIKTIKEEDRATTTPSSTSLSDLQEKVLAMFPATGGGITVETDPTVIPEVKSLTSADVASFKAAATATSNGVIGTSGNQSGISGNKTLTGRWNFQGGINTTNLFANADGVALNLSNPSNGAVFAQFAGNAGREVYFGAPTIGGWTPNGNRLTVDGTTLLNGLATTQDIRPDIDGRQVGSGTLAYGTAYIRTILSNGLATFGTSNASTSSIRFIQGSNAGTDVVGGFHPNSGGFYIQARGAAPSVNGYMASINGSLLTTGRIDATDTWANGQISAGGTSNGGNIQINRGDATGTTALNIRTINATSANSEIVSIGSLSIRATSSNGLALAASATSGNLTLAAGGITARMTIKSDGIINYSNVPTYADNAAATTGGLVVGDVYRTATGQLMIRY